MQEIDPLYYQKCLIFAKDKGIDTSHIPSELGYFLIFPFPCREIAQHQPIEKHYVILTFEHQDTTIGELLKKFMESHTQYQGLQDVRFQLSDGRVLHEDLTVAKLTRKAELQSIDGLFLFIKSKDNKKDWMIMDNFETGDDSKIQDECALQGLFVPQQGKENRSMMNMNFILPGSNVNGSYQISIKRPFTNNFNQVKEELRKRVKQYFQFDLKSLVDVNYIILPRNSKDIQRLIPKNQHERKLPLINHLYTWCTIRLQTSGKINLKRKILHPEYRLIIQKQNGKQSIDVSFEEVQFMSFRNLYRKKLVIEERKNDRSNSMCLKVMDLVIREDQPLSILSPYYRHNEQNNFVRLVGKVVSEKMYFYKTMRDLVIKTQNFQINKYIRSSNIKEDDKKFRDRLRKEVQKRASNANHPHFKIESHVQPLYIYTCEDIHVNSKSSADPVYRHINFQLRTKPVVSIEQKKIQKDWEYIFTSHLMDQLNNIRSEMITVYRGDTYDPMVNVGDILTLKSFTSTSVDPGVAQAFKNKTDQSTDRTIFTMRIRNGKNIERFSAYVSEKQRLLQPYTQFKVLKVKKYSEKKGSKIVTFRQIQMEELPENISSKQFPQTVSNFILWIDNDKSSEPEKIYKSITKFSDSTVLITFTSTEQLQRWLKEEKAKNIFSDKSSNIAFLTNMTRYENNTKNQLAGIDAIERIQKVAQWDIPVMLYVGYRKGAQQKLMTHAKRLKNPKQIKIGTSLDEARRFLADYLIVEFDNIKPNGSKKSI